MWGRADGERIASLATLRRFLPLLLPRRNDAVVYFEQQVEVEAIAAFLAAHMELLAGLLADPAALTRPAGAVAGSA